MDIALVKLKEFFFDSWMYNQYPLAYSLPSGSSVLTLWRWRQPEFFLVDGFWILIGNHCFFFGDLVSLIIIGILVGFTKNVERKIETFVVSWKTKIK